MRQGLCERISEGFGGSLLSEGRIREQDGKERVRMGFVFFFYFFACLLRARED